eukprot:353679-Chlamydomonas_euryale.AAC.4
MEDCVGGCLGHVQCAFSLAGVCGLEGQVPAFNGAAGEQAESEQQRQRQLANVKPHTCCSKGLTASRR